jgi:hypothetical protein
MPCLVVDMPGGGKAIVKLAPERKRRCKFCGVGWVSRLCDFKTGEAATCDAGMCARCAYPVARDVDYCPTHRKAHLAQRAQKEMF